MTRSTPRAWWVLLRPVFVAQRRALVVMTAWSVLEAAPVLVSGQFLARALDHGFLAGDLTAGLGWLAGYGAALVLGAFGTRQVLTPVAEVVEELRDHLVRTVVDEGLREAVADRSGTDPVVVTRITRQAEAMRQMAAALLLAGRPVLFSAVAVLAGLATLVPVIAVLTLVALLIALVLLRPLTRAMRVRQHTALLTEERLTEDTGRVFEGLRDVAAAGAAATAARSVGAAVDAHAAAVMAATRTGAWRIGVIAIGARLPLVLALLLTPWLVTSGAATPGELLGAAIYLVTGLEPALRSLVLVVANLGVQLSVTLGRLTAAGRGHRPSGSSPAGRDGEDDLGDGTVDLRLRAVTFAYGRHSAPVLRDLDLHLPAGIHAAVIGASGTGKSTLAGVLAGLDPPQRGTVTLGGVPLHRVPGDRLRRTVALVPQEAYVFRGSLRENVAYPAVHAGDTALDRAVTDLGLDALAHRLGGYDAPIDPRALSAGERQLVTLARVYLSPATVVVLDEATCHLDPAAERRAEEAFARRDGTLIVVAHRLSSARRADLIILLDGAEARVGDHGTLLATSARYADLHGRWTAPIFH